MVRAIARPDATGPDILDPVTWGGWTGPSGPSERPRTAGRMSPRCRPTGSGAGRPAGSHCRARRSCASPGYRCARGQLRRDGLDSRTPGRSCSTGSREPIANRLLTLLAELREPQTAAVGGNAHLLRPLWNSCGEAVTHPEGGKYLIANGEWVFGLNRSATGGLGRCWLAGDPGSGAGSPAGSPIDAAWLHRAACCLELDGWSSCSAARNPRHLLDVIVLAEFAQADRPDVSRSRMEQAVVLRRG